MLVRVRAEANIFGAFYTRRCELLFFHCARNCARERSISPHATPSNQRGNKEPLRPCGSGGSGLSCTSSDQGKICRVINRA